MLFLRVKHDGACVSCRPHHHLYLVIEGLWLHTQDRHIRTKEPKSVPIADRNVQVPTREIGASLFDQSTSRGWLKE